MSDASPKSTRATPLWKAIATALRADISEARYAPGDKLPTEAELARRFGVNRHTVRQGVKALADEGLLRSRRGAGVFVAGQPTDYPLGRRVRFHENLLAAGRRPDKQMLLVEAQTAPKGVATALRIAEGAPVCVVRGLSLADDTPLALFESTFPLDRLPGLLEIFEAQSSVTQALREAGVADYTRASTRLTAVAADATQALHLHLTEGAPLIRSTSVNVDAEGVPVEYGRTFFAGDRVTLTLET